MSTIVHVVGARPNYMKIAPVWRALTRYEVDQQLVHTGQHYDPNLKDVFFGELPLPAPDVELHIGSGSHGAQTAKALAALEETFVRLAPDLVVVPGDINSTLAAALAAVKLEIPVCHVEAGLRSYDRTMPEEHNRRVTDHLSSLLLTTCADGNENLAREGIVDGVRLVGNTMIDTLEEARGPAEQLGAWAPLGLERGAYVLVTLHRPALVDNPALLRRTIEALAGLSAYRPVVFPIHPRTQARIDDLDLSLPSSLRMLPSLSYTSFLSLELGAAAVLTDSGGVQEETTALGVPCFTLRENTERPVTITEGTNTLIGLEPERIADIPRLLEMADTSRRPPLWDGRAGDRAAVAIAELYGLSLRVPVRAHAPGERG